MGKRQILVHECGHIVQPGDILVFTCTRGENQLKVGDEAKFICINMGTLHVRWLSEERYVNLFPERFGCSIMEIDDV